MPVKLAVRIATVCTCLACTALVTAAIPMAARTTLASPSPPSALTTRAFHDGASTITDLRERRLSAPQLESGARCPRATVNRRLKGVGPTVEAGPIAAAVFSENAELSYDDEAHGRNRAKVLWLVRGDQPGPVIVRGRRIGSRAMVTFTNRQDVFRTYPLRGDAVSTAPPDWRDIPSSVEVPGPGCYVLQVDGRDFQSVFVLAAEPDT